MSEGNSKEVQEDYLKRLKYVSYQQEIDSHYVILLPRFPFCYGQEQGGLSALNYWDSLSEETKIHFRNLYKSGGNTSAYSILYPPMCDKRVMEQLNNEYEPIYD